MQREVSHLKLQIENELSKNALISKENSAINEELQHIKLELSKESLGHKKLATESHKLNELLVKLKGEIDGERSARSELKKEYDNLSHRAQEEKNRQHILLDEILNLKTTVSNAQGDRSKMSTQLSQAEAAFQNLRDQYNQLVSQAGEQKAKLDSLEKKKNEFENLGAFSESLMKSVPIFQTKVDELATKLGAVSLTEGEVKVSYAESPVKDTTAMQESLNMIKESTDQHHEKYMGLFQTVLTSLTTLQKKVSELKSEKSQKPEESSTVSNDH